MIINYNSCKVEGFNDNNMNNISLYAIIWENSYQHRIVGVNLL